MNSNMILANTYESIYIIVKVVQMFKVFDETVPKISCLYNIHNDSNLLAVK